jgi:hypothetical protein
VRATLEFNLPEERTEHLQAVHAGAAWALLEDIDQHLRSVIKHGHDYKTVEALAEHIRREIGDVRSGIDP